MTKKVTIKSINNYSYLLFTIASILFSLSSQSQVYFNDLEDKNVKGNWIGLSTIDSDSAYSGTYYSKTDSLNPYGLGIEQRFPNDLHRTNTMLTISGYVKSNLKNNHALYVMTLTNGKETLLWKGIPLAPIFKEKDIWYYFSDSILVPANLTSNSKLKAYLWNQDKSATTGIDNLKIEFKTFDNPTFIPVLTDDTNNNITKKSTLELFSNGYYNITFDNTISISGNTNDNILNNISYFSEGLIKGVKTTHQLNWKYTGSTKTKNGKELKFKASDRYSKLNLVLICNDYSPEIQFVVEEKYKRKQLINRSSLIFNYSQPLEKIYRNNRLLDTLHFKKEYWLDKQGVKIGKGKNSLLIYHTPHISSLQIDTDNQLMVANLDYEKDHPFFRFPLNPDSSNWKKEESTSQYKKGDKREYHFKLNVGNNVKTLPRFMKNPAGFEATYIWTEHADFTDIKTNRATYFGSEKISHLDSTTGGFVHYNIPVTKSVLYDNPDSISNYDISNGAFPTLESAIQTDSLFSEFLFQIAEKGSEICLHTPEQFTTTPERFEEALSYMQTNFGSPSWIDHGNNNGHQNNREDLICDGTLEDSPYYAVDLWNSYGVKYVHNAYYEELNTYKGWQYEGSLEKPYSGFGDFFPKPDYYKHPTRSHNMIHWTTTSALFVKEPYLWDYLFNMNKLQKLVENRAIEINHTYPPWVDQKKGMWTWNSDSIIVAQPGLNRTLANMAQLRDEGRLNVCTVANFLDYRTSIDKIKYSILPDGRIRLTNDSDSDIKKLAMVAKAKAVTVNGIIPNYKIVGDEIIFWFDIGVGNTIIIRIIE